MRHPNIVGSCKSRASPTACVEPFQFCGVTDIGVVKRRDGSGGVPGDSDSIRSNNNNEVALRKLFAVVRREYLLIVAE